MNVKELKSILKKSKVSDSLYNLDNEGRNDERFCLDYREGKWNVYYLERGIKTTNLFFKTESEACEYIYKHLVK